MRRFGRVSVLVLPVVLLLASGPASALEDLSPVLPEDTVLYARVAGPSALLADIATSRLMTDGAVLADAYASQIALLAPFLSAETGIPKGKWEKVFGSISGAHLAMFGVGNELSDLDAVLAVETSEPVLAWELIEKLLGPEAYFAGEVAGARVMAIDLEGEDATFFFAAHGGLIFAASRAERITAILTARETAPERSLATAARYRSGTLRASPDATLFAWADLQRGLDLLTSIMPEYELRDFLEAQEIMQLDKLFSIAVVAEANTTRVRVTYDPEHRWMKALAGEAGSGSLSAFVPENVLLFSLECGSIEKKWAGLRKLLTDPGAFPEAAEVKEELGQIEEFLGASFDEIAKTLGGQWGLFLPVEEGGRIDDDDLTILFEIGDREAFDALLVRLLESPAMAELREEGGELVTEIQGEAKVMYPKSEDADREVPALAIVGDALIVSGDLNALRAALAAKSSGRNLLSGRGASLDGIPSSFVRFFAMGMDAILMDESDFTPLLDLARPGALLVAATDEAPGRMDLNFNHSLTSFITFLVGGELLSERYSEERSACLSNLREISNAVEEYKKAKGEAPPNLRALVPEFLPKHRLVCPLDKGHDVDCSYGETLTGSDQGEWEVLAWCRNRLHRRLALYYGGNAYSTRESSFIRQLQRQGVDPR